MADGMNTRPGKNAPVTVPVWDHAGLSRQVADDMTAVFGSEQRAAPRNETVIFSHPKAVRTQPSPSAGSRRTLGLVVRVGLILAAGAVGLSAGWLLTHPPGRATAQSQDIAAPAVPPAGGLSVQGEGAPK